MFVVYDELVGKEPVEWNYLLHTVELPMEVAEEKDGLRILGKNKADGVSIAHLFSSQKMTYAQTDTFFVAAVDWKNDLAKLSPIIIILQQRQLLAAKSVFSM